MKCKEIQDKINQFYEGELLEKENFLFEEHLSVCKTCAQDYEVFKTAVVALGSLEDIQAPADLIVNVNKRIDSLEKRVSIFSKLFSSKTLLLAPQLASVVLFIVMGVMVYQIYGVYNDLLKQDSSRSDRLAQIDLPEIQESKDRKDSVLLKSVREAPEPVPTGEGSGVKAGVREDSNPSKAISGYSLEPESSLRARSSAAQKTSVNEQRIKDGDIEVIPLRRNHEVMGKEIESLVVTSNGRIIRVKRGPKAPREMLISIPSKSYSDFMKRLREAMKKHVEQKKLEMDKIKSRRLNKSVRLQSPKKIADEKVDEDILSEPKSQQAFEVAGEEESLSEKETPVKEKSEKKIPEVRLIRLIYE